MSSVIEQFNKFEALIQHLPAGWQELAIENRAFVRSRQIKSPLELLRLVFTYLIADNSLRSLAATLISRRIWMTDQGVFNRLNHCRDWLEKLLGLMLDQQLAARIPDGGTIVQRRLKIVDATVLNCPGAKGEDYRLHLCFEAIGQNACAIKLSDKRMAESLTHFQYQAGEIVLGDRIYAKARQIIAVAKQAADVIVRLSFQQMNLFTVTGKNFDWKQLLIDAETIGKFSTTAFIKDRVSREQVQVWIHGKRLGEREREKARRKIRLQAIKTGCQTREATVKLSEWIVVLTTLAETELNGEEVLELYRLRWQIEIYFKRLKGLIHLGRMRGKRGSALAEADIFGRLLLALLLAAESGRKLWADWNSLTSARAATNYGIWKAMLEELREAVLETGKWMADEWRRKLKTLRQRKRKRRLKSMSRKVLNKLKPPEQLAFAAKANELICLLT